jgi:hypothetical protein
VTLALLHDFRTRWLTSPLPMVVEHVVGGPETICAAPSLWMGGKLVAERLRELGIREGSRVRYDGPSGALFVQALVGVLRTGAAFVAEALDGAEPHAVVHEDLSVTSTGASTSLGASGLEDARSGAPRSKEDESVRMIFRAADGKELVRLSEEDIDALAAAGAELLRRPSVDDALRIGCLGDWRDWRVAVVELLGGLALGSELHLGFEKVPSRQLEAIHSLPDVIVRRGVVSLYIDQRTA